MDLQSIIKALINTRGLTYKDVGDKMGGITTQAVSDRLNRRGSMTVGNLLRYLDALGYELAIRDKSQKADAWVVTGTTSSNKGEC